MLEVSFQAKHRDDGPRYRIDIANDLTSQDWFQLAQTLDILYTQVRAAIRHHLSNSGMKEYTVDGGMFGIHKVSLRDSPMSAESGQ